MDQHQRLSRAQSLVIEMNPVDVSARHYLSFPVLFRACG
jgi:hypothetical protein